ncbi:hypoxanthine-guanine phosphoribosyltransferase [Pseudofulvimonas gallinarii]|uniref:Hypoxanthine phosphoribosyltransferase n=1 Tax=Pseudofulvimonas gallinarii TaxID=634155 RepID=A0A4S3L0E2_9GAMM|nr:hypoxanthine-guanine phosphoribosyltransferase [Pseudofulvimonas gallinarii]TCT01346.1 hypoxanthine phosphoribosyltransferase [Pseudofulvimonas gallinarii]THD15173.1 hypoxanthine-guanine phosphoribosyltransferase [Pseudofulvimonas gallinarii]
MTTNQTFSAVLAEADLLHDGNALDAAIRDMATRIDADYSQMERPVFLTVMHGGLFFAARLALCCHTDFEFDYVHATRYRGTAGGGLNWIKEPGIPLAGRHVLLADDILDEGPTLLAILEHCRVQGAASVRIAVLADKLHDRRAEGISAHYVGVTVPDRYVFGYGMDWHGHGRNLDGIYAMAEVEA